MCDIFACNFMKLRSWENDPSLYTADSHNQNESDQEIFLTELQHHDKTPQAHM